MELLNAIWGDAPGKRVILFKKGGQKLGGRNEFFDDNAAAWAWLSKKNGEGFEVWFAMALYDESGRRKQPNVRSVNSFWLDIDYGATKPYASLDDAATALASFCDRLRLPLPTLVGSGVGLHAHWIVDQRIDRERWKKTARALKNACVRLEFKPGAERTADEASVLRVPGTKHLKYLLREDPTLDGPRDVVLFGAIQEVVSLALFEQALTPYLVIDNARVANKVFETNLPQIPYDANKIADECPVIRTMRDTRGLVSEPIWYGALQVLHHCTDGEEIAHAWSEGHESYSFQGTEEKFERAKEFGPTLCARFGEYDPEGCAGCSHRGKITTPLQLGASLSPVIIRPAEAVRPGVAVSDNGRSGSDTTSPMGDGEANSLPDTGWAPSYISPPHYEVGAQGVYYFDEEAEKRIPVLDIPLWVSQLTNTVREADMEATVEWVTRIGTHRRSAIRADILMDMRATGMWLASRGITGFSPRGLEAVKNYVWACIQVYQHTKGVEVVYERFGWSDSGFVLGDTIITPDGPAKAKLASRVPTKMVKGFTQKGTVEAWALATKALDEPKYLPHQFTLIAILGSVLFYLMGVQGAVLSLAGDSGVGKTTIGLFGLAAFGNPKALEISPQSTERAFHELWYVAGNLPVLINEAATLDLFKLSSLIYAAANGQARSILTQKSELRESDGWQLLTVFTSNSHLMSLDEKWLNEANRRRILELTLSKTEHEMDRSVALVLHRTMTENYGIAGRLFVQYCVEHRKALTDSLLTSYDLYAKGDIPAEHRFNLWTIAVARVAGIIGEKIGILMFDTQPCYEWAIKQVRSYAETVQTAEQKGDDIFANYTAEHQGALTRYIAKQAMWTVDIRGECAGRYTQAEDNSWTISVPAAKFATYARERGLDKQHLAQWMQTRKVAQRTSLLVPLGSRMKVYVIKIDGSLDDA